MAHVLIVDDVLENIQLLGRLLRQRIEGTIAVAQDGEAALRAVDYRRPDLILFEPRSARRSVPVVTRSVLRCSPPSPGGRREVPVHSTCGPQCATVPSSRALPRSL